MTSPKRRPTNHVRIKICGITRAYDAMVASNAGADAIGLVFYPLSPRSLSPEEAQEICLTLPPFLVKVGLFVNADPAWIEHVLDHVPIDVLQFHGDENSEDCRRYSKPYIKAVRMRSDTRLEDYDAAYPDASALLLDTYHDGLYGGTGQVFDWSKDLPAIEKPLIAAGGLRADNVARAIKQLKPYAVDVSGGVESSKGIKDAEKIVEFIREVRYAKQ